tara:strand:- start:1050 stop:1478 length:429 start_codon:yes stop_codon:yes gene_type:complete
MNTFGYKNNKESDITEKAYKYYSSITKNPNPNYRMLAHDKLKYATQYNNSLEHNNPYKNYDYMTTPIEKIRETLFLNNVKCYTTHINLKSDNQFDQGHNILHKDMLDITLELWDRNQNLENELNRLKEHILKIEDRLVNIKK